VSTRVYDRMGSRPGIFRALEDSDKKNAALKESIGKNMSNHLEARLLQDWRWLHRVPVESFGNGKMDGEFWSRRDKIWGELSKGLDLFPFLKDPDVRSEVADMVWGGLEPLEACEKYKETIHDKA